jgi:hypothetical protein
MGLWSRLFGGERPPAGPQAFAPVEVVPGQLRASAFEHDVKAMRGIVRCVTFVSDGLQSVGHREVSITLVRSSGQDVERLAPVMFELFRSIQEWGRKGALARAGTLTTFGPQGFPAVPGATGIAWIRGEHLEGVEAGLGSRLAGVFLMGEELQVAQRCGVTRVLTHLGNAARWYPCPPWSERGRRPLIDASSIEVSLIGRLPTLRVDGLHVRLDGDDHVVLRILEGSRPQLAALEKAPDGALVLLADVDPEATACMLWSPGQKERHGISAPHHDAAHPRIAGTCLIVVPGVEQEDARPFEDGLSIMLTAGTWSELRRCLIEGAPFERALGRARFSLSWTAQRWVNPIDGRTLHAEAGWQHLAPAGGSRTDGPEIMLLTSQDDIAHRVELSSFSGYLGALLDAMRAWPASDLGGDALRVQVDLAPGAQPRIRARVGLITERDPPLRERADALSRIAPPSLTGPIAFQIVQR